jgi:hypothetical protein
MVLGLWTLLHSTSTNRVAGSAIAEGRRRTSRCRVRFAPLTGGVGRKLRNLYFVYLVVHAANLQKPVAYTNTQAIELMQERVVVTRHYVPAHPYKLRRVNQMVHLLISSCYESPDVSSAVTRQQRRNANTLWDVRTRHCFAPSVFRTQNSEQAASLPQW